MPTELPSPHRERVEAQLRLLEAARASLPPGVEGTVAPYFAHLRVSSGGRRRDVLLGPRTHVGGRVTILNWHEAPLAAAFFAAAEGEDYEIDVEGDGNRTLTGTVLEKNLLGFERGELVEILTPELALSRRSGRWEVRGEVERLRLDPRPAGSRSASPVEVPLNPAQRRVVDLPPGGAVLLLGEAGSGKTTVALHRLAHLVHAAEAERRRFRGGVIVPTEGLRRFAQAMLERLGAGTVEVRTWDAWAAAESRRAFPDVPPGDSEGASAAVVRLKRHRALAVAIEALVARRPRSGKPAGARRRDLLHLFGDRLLMEQVVAAAGSGLPAAALPEVLEHTRVQFNRPTEAESGHVDAERLKTVDQRRIDEGTPMEDAGTVDVEDHAVLFAIDRRRARVAPAGGPGEAIPRRYDCLLVDEAQELAPLELQLLGRAVPQGGTLVVAGDEGQQVDPSACFADWPTTMADLGADEHTLTTLEVSYRSPPEVTTFARALLGRAGGPHGHPASGASPGERVLLRRFDDECHLAAALVEALAEVRSRDPQSTAAVICRNADGARRWARVLSWGLNLQLALDGDFSFGPGLNVTSVDEVKGLEFDHVVLPDASATRYPDTPEARRALYVAVTRTVHQLVLACVGTPSPLLPLR